MTLRTIISGISGGIVYWLTAFLFYTVLFADFFGKNWGEGHRDAVLMWSIILSSLFFGLLFAFIFDKWAGARTFKTGALAGAVLGVLHALNLNFLRYGDSTLYDNLTPVLVNIFLNTVMAVIAGGVIGFTLGKMTKSAD